MATMQQPRWFQWRQNYVVQKLDTTFAEEARVPAFEPDTAVRGNIRASQPLRPGEEKYETYQMQKETRGINCGRLSAHRLH